MNPKKLSIYYTVRKIMSKYVVLECQLSHSPRNVNPTNKKTGFGHHTMFQNMFHVQKFWILVWIKTKNSCSEIRAQNH